MELHGFKSFAEPVSFDFTEGMTCIVGPNGSGKSNIADAIKWVLGEQSAKNLRGGKMEEVIFSGTESRKARGLAEATLVIDNEDRALPVEYSEVAITRRMYRSGESEYFINRRPCRMKDVKELIMDTGMGVEGYSLISQGKIAEIVNNKAEGRRELFEEAAGIVKYRTRKKDAERKLSASSSNLDRVNDIISEIEGRIDGLREDSEKAEEYLELSKKYRTIEINLAVRQAESLETRLSELKTDIEESKKEADSLAKEKAENDEGLEAAKQKEADLEERGNRVNSELMGLVETIAAHKNEIEVSEEKLAAFRRDNTRIEGEVLRINREILEEEAAVEAFEDRRISLTGKKSVIEEEISEKEKIYLTSSEKLRDLQEKIEEKRSEVFRLHSGINIGKTEITGLKTFIDDLEKRRQKLMGDISDSRETLADIAGKKTEAETDIENLTAEKSEIRGRAAETEEDLSHVKSEEKKLREERTSAAGELHKAETKRDLLIGFESSYEGYAQAVRFIMSAKGRLPGITGPASDLIEVPEGLETAIQTALAGSLQNIVCDDDRAASRAVDLLKKERGGRATFLPVSSIRPGKDAADSPDASSMRGEPGFVGFGTESVTFSPEYRGVITYLLGRTVITDDLDSAVRMSKKYNSGLRFVTAEGELINPSGAITGGKFKREATNVFERKNEIKALEAFAAGEKTRIENLDREISEKQKTISELVNKISTDGRTAEGIEARLSEIRRQSEMLGERGAAIRDNISRWENEINSIEKDIKETSVSISSIEKEVGSKEGEIAENEGAMDSQIKSLEEARASADGFLEEINRLKLSAYSVESDLKHTEAGLRNSRFALERLRNEAKEREEDRIRTRVFAEETEEVIEAAAAALEEAEKKQKSLREESLFVRREREAVAESKKEYEAFAKEFDERLTEANTRVYDLQIKTARSETQLEGIKNNLWDNFEVSFLEARAMKKEPFAVTSAARESREIRGRMKELEPVNIGAIEEYRQVSERYTFMTAQREDLNSAIASLEDIIRNMDRIITSRFMESFNEIGKQFKKTFADLFGGGSAEIKLENADDVLESVIEIAAQPPGKKLQNINLMSGGEKSLTAIALLCSILKVRPAPFCILDEVEAALDDSNIGRFVDYIRAFDGMQFIVVTHQKVTMEKADALYGITMPEKGVSKVVSLRLPNN